MRIQDCKTILAASSRVETHHSSISCLIVFICHLLDAGILCTYSRYPLQHLSWKMFSPQKHSDSSLRRLKEKRRLNWWSNLVSENFEANEPSNRLINESLRNNFPFDSSAPHLRNQNFIFHPSWRICGWSIIIIDWSIQQIFNPKFLFKVILKFIFTFIEKLSWKEILFIWNPGVVDRNHKKIFRASTTRKRRNIKNLGQLLIHRAPNPNDDRLLCVSRGLPLITTYSSRSDACFPRAGRCSRAWIC